MMPSQFTAIQAFAVQVLDTFRRDHGYPNEPPVPVEIIAELTIGLHSILDSSCFGATTAIGLYDELDNTMRLREDTSLEQRRFTIAHEIGHAVLHATKHASSNVALIRSRFYPHIIRSSRTDNNEEYGRLIEIEANTFAAALLMPETQLLPFSSAYSGIGIEEVYDIAHEFGVSFASAAYRLLDLVRYNYWRGPRIHVSRLDWFLNIFPSSPFEGSPPLESARIAASHENQRIERKFAKAFTRLLDLEESKAPGGRPIFVEFCGTPRAGKDSTIDVVREYLEDVLGVRVGVIDEDVKDWWSKDPRSIYRSCLSVMSTLHTARIENPGDCDVILANRNTIDRIAFLRHLMIDAEPTAAKLARAHITLLQMYAQRLVDLVVMLIISPDEAMERESQKGGTRSTVERIARIKGNRSALREPRSILKSETLSSLNKQYQLVSREQGPDLKAIWVCDGSIAGDMSLIEKSISVIDIIVGLLRDNSGTSDTVRRRVTSQERNELTKQIHELVLHPRVSDAQTRRQHIGTGSKTR